MPAERVRLRIGNLAKAVLVTGQAYQDPEGRAERVRVERGRRVPGAAASAAGASAWCCAGRASSRSSPSTTTAAGCRPTGCARWPATSSSRRRRTTCGRSARRRSGCSPSSSSGGRCDVVSRARGLEETWTLQLERGTAVASLDRERRRARTMPGTTRVPARPRPRRAAPAHPTQGRRLPRQRRGPALPAATTAIEVVEGRDIELVTPVRPDGVRLALPPRRTLLGSIELAPLRRRRPATSREPWRWSGGPAPRSSTTSPSSTSWPSRSLVERPGERADRVRVAAAVGRATGDASRTATPSRCSSTRCARSTPMVDAAATQVAREVDAATADACRTPSGGSSGAC